MFVILEHPTSADCLSSGRPPEPLPGHHTGDTRSSLEHSPRAWREREEPTWHLGDGQCLKAITCCCSLGEGRRGCGCVTAVAPIPAPSMGCLSRALALCRCWHALIASPIAAVNLPRLGIQTSPSLVMASHHSYLLLQKMKGLRNAFIHVTVCIILLCALNFQSGTRRCLNHSNAAQSAPAGRCPFHRAHLLRAALRGHPLHSTQMLPVPQQSPHLHPIADTWLPCSEFCSSLVLFLTASLCKIHLLLPSPSSSSFKGF